ncbi:MAG TPA: ferredoxin [Acidimicrobiales bacterium]|nr:ferredoxin [Acidimicrobiales bacterium]
MKLTIDEALCAGHGRCYTLSPALVQADDEGFPVQRGRPVDVPPELEDDARKIVANCPEGAIKLSEG